MNYRPASQLNLSTTSAVAWLNSLVTWTLNWVNQNFVLLAALGAGWLATKVFRIRLNVGGK